ncbi:MAG: hypothetical protein ABSA86_11190 [Oryzomonas sp.]|jgi:hypothetical protein
MNVLPVLIVMVFLLWLNPCTVSATDLTVTHQTDGSVTILSNNASDRPEQVDLDILYSTACGEPVPKIIGKAYSEKDMLLSKAPGKIHLAIGLDEGELFIGMTLSFKVKPANQPCLVNSIAAKYIYADGNTEWPEVKITPPEAPAKTPGITPDQAAAASQGMAETKAAGTTATVQPLDPTARPDADGAHGIPTPDVERGGQGTASGAALNPLEYRRCPDILQRFREFRGDRNLGNLISLLSGDSPCGVKQTPAIAISDGLGKVAVTLEAEPSGRNSPEVGVTGARILNLRRLSERVWNIELIPNKGEHTVVLYLLTGQVLQVMPLIVAPPLELYLSGLTPGENLSPLLEFVVAANYLASRNDKSAKTGQ